MPSPLKHLVIFGLALPASLAGYHYYAGAFGSEGQAATRSISAAVDRLTRTDEYRLSDLRLLEKDLWYVETRYVEPERLNTDSSAAWPRCWSSTLGPTSSCPRSSTRS